MSETNRRRTWQPVAKVENKPINCSVCGQQGASYGLSDSFDAELNWYCWQCVPKDSYYKRGDHDG
tara:strand:+ start:354 stop:548 length:195 start_codon:yes stop_codon:yes gene_type:complete